MVFALDRMMVGQAGVTDLDQSVSRTRDDELAAERRRDLLLLIASAVLTAPMVVPLFRFPFGTPLHLNPWIELVLATPVQFVVGATIYRRAWRALLALSCSVDLLVALGTTVAYIASAVLVLRYGLEASGIVYFEVSSAIVTLAAFGAWLDEQAFPSAGEPGQRLADRIADVAVPAAFALGFATLLGWSSSGRGFEYASFVAMTVFIIACPGALALATPAALFAGVRAAARRGITFKDAAAIERLARLDSIVFDRTGTLTEGRAAVVGIELAPGVDAPRLVRLAAALQVASNHPLAAAFCAAAPVGVRLPSVERFRVEPGRGVLGVVEGREVAVGGRNLIIPAGIDIGRLDPALARFEREGKAGFIVAVGGRALGVIAVSDPPRPHAQEAVRRLAALGLRPDMLSPDNVVVAGRIATELGLAGAITAHTPDEKGDAIRALERQGRRVGVVGTSPFDAGTGIIMGAGPNQAIAADASLTRFDPRLVPAAIEVARRTVAATRRNMLFATIFNIVGVPVAIMGSMGPEVAAAALGAAIATITGGSVWVVLRQRHI
jgi:P-type Cu+ transporter